MKSKYFIFILLLIPLSCSQKGATKEDSAQIDSVYFQGIELPIHYNEWQLISFDVCINGEDSLYATFDTGAFGVSIPNNLKNKYFKLKDSLHIATGSYSKTFTESVKFVSWHIPSRTSNDNDSTSGILLGWNFFEDTIIELSFGHEYIKILDNTDYLSGYDSIQFTKNENRLYIPTSVSIQGENINSLSLIDTGFNSTFVSNRSVFPNIDYTKSEKAYGFLSGHKKFTGHFLLADTIKIGNSHICNRNICITDNNELILSNSSYESFIGNGFFENFTLVFDFKNNMLYMKPISDKPVLGLNNLTIL